MTPDLTVGLIVLTLLLVLEGTVPFYVDRAHRLRHGLRNGSLALLNAGIGALLAPLLLLAAESSSRHQFGLLHQLGMPGVLGAVLAGVLTILLFDLWMYGWHRANHRMPLLWRFHQVHHTDRAMDATTALRFHPGELLISSLLNPLVVFLLGIGLAQLTLYKALMLTVILLHHSNVALPAWLETRLRALIVPPSMHRVHHSRIPDETNSNYGSLFSFWDRLFGSFRLRSNLSQVQFGTGRHDEPEWQAVPKLLRLPLTETRVPESLPR
ncbi:MAG: sterol desaturase family protein [Gammaproteobacteria bacterium]|jgi:sterol desaturase/sphingolipid hydroxylase (fatty acid hydroxylase superfamily)|nr:sterol desaturase family protein [Gammaproteobacteria bacterium]